MSLFDERKAAEAAAYLVAKAGGVSSYTRLSALLYLSERESLRQYAEPLFGDVLVAIDSGPALRKIHAFLAGMMSPESMPHLSQWIDKGSKYGQVVKAKRSWRESDKALSRLSEADFGILDGVWAQFGSLSKEQLVDYLRHHLPEWSDPYGSTKLIPLISLLRHLGYATDVAADIHQHLTEQAQLNQGFAAAA